MKLFELVCSRIDEHFVINSYNEKKLCNTRVIRGNGLDLLCNKNFKKIENCEVKNVDKFLGFKKQEMIKVII